MAARSKHPLVPVPDQQHQQHSSSCPLSQQADLNGLTLSAAAVFYCTASMNIDFEVCTMHGGGALIVHGEERERDRGAGAFGPEMEPHCDVHSNSKQAESGLYAFTLLLFHTITLSSYIYHTFTLSNTAMWTAPSIPPPLVALWLKTIFCTPKFCLSSVCVSLFFYGHFSMYGLFF